MVDKDGGFSYSKIEMVQPKEEEKQVSIYPNPANDKLTIDGLNRNITKLKIFDIYGIDRTTMVSIKSLENTVEINIQNLPKGMYFISSKELILKFSKQ